MNSATYMFVHVTKYARRHSNPAVTTILLEGSEKLFIRQSWELKWRRFTLHCPAEKEYFAMVDGMTGAMFQLILRLMLTLVHNGEQSSENKSFDVLARTLGRWYQVRDDYLNLRDTGSTKKGFCEDLDDGKFSYPVVRSCADPGRKDLLVGILHGRDATEGTALPLESKLRVLTVISEAGAMQETWQLILQLQSEVEKEISRLEDILGEDNPMLRVLVKVLGDIPEPWNTD